MTPEQFGRECAAASKQLRRIPAELRKALGQRTRDEVASPLADRVKAAPAGVYGRAVAGTVRVRSKADPTLVVGGQRRVASGGATGRQLVYGSQFGGGSRVTAVAGRAGRKGYSRRSTRQFARHAEPFVARTVIQSVGWAFDRWASIVDDVLNKEGP